MQRDNLLPCPWAVDQVLRENGGPKGQWWWGLGVNPLVAQIPLEAKQPQSSPQARKHTFDHFYVLDE
jgi:hypothetical protein